ncbi:hypothetical protein FRZ40_41455 [Paraburkholderia azotifigens]|uniref:Uncharacterized protein n=1 Tax=Paraburkholderia azotifigens TaxID=2057004 RepID=A0A5C6V7E3_9BURK|nr:hypothetical protein FRZ40_41455 [Paraburkholderia azotifigens]
MLPFSSCRRETDERTPVITAPMPPQSLPGSNASAAMIATVTAGKYVDGTLRPHRYRCGAESDSERRTVLFGPSLQGQVKFSGRHLKQVSRQGQARRAWQICERSCILLRVEMKVCHAFLRFARHNRLQASGRMFWFTWKKFVGSYLALIC